MLITIDNLALFRPERSGYRLHIEQLHIARGERIAVTGPSGCGKSTALDLLGMVLRPSSAEAFVFAPEDEPLDIAAAWKKNRLDFMADLRSRHMGYVLQTGGLLPFLTVAQNIAVPARMKGLSESDIADAMGELAECLGIARLLAEPPGRLSVGERQRAAIARALIARPRVVLADEPTAALDPVHAARVMERFLEAVSQCGATLIMVTHDERLVSRFQLREIPVRIRDDGDAVMAVINDRGAP